MIFWVLIRLKLQFFDIANLRNFLFAFLTPDHVKKLNDDDDDDVYRLYQEPYFPKKANHM